MTRRMSAAGGKATITLLHPSVLRLTWLPRTEISEADAEDVIKRSLVLVGHVPYAVLADMRQILAISFGARGAFAVETEVSAVALLGDSPMDRVLAASVEQAIHPVQFFTNENAALSWLTSYLAVPEQTS